MSNEIIDTKIINNRVHVKLPCQICGKVGWFIFEARMGYICRDCKYVNTRLPYFYMTCNNCKRVFYANNREAKTCIKCLVPHWRPTRRKRAIVAKDLIDGELFYCVEYLNTVFLKYGKDVIYYGGDGSFNIDVVMLSINIYKYSHEALYENKEIS